MVCMAKGLFQTPTEAELQNFHFKVQVRLRANKMVQMELSKRVGLSIEETESGRISPGESLSNSKTTFFNNKFMVLVVTLEHHTLARSMKLSV